MTHKTAIAALVLAVAGPAHAQVTPIRYNEGPGVKLTDSLVFHPGAALETRFDSNPLSTNSNASRAVGGEVPSAAYLRMIAHLHLATLSAQRMQDASSRAAPQKVQFRLKSAFAYREYLTDVTQIANLRALEIDAGMNLKLAPTRMFQLEVLDDYQRRISPRNSVIIAGRDFSGETVNLNRNRAMARAHIVPGGGRLRLMAGYGLNLHAYEGTDFAENNRLSHELTAGGRYLLLPKSAVMLEVNQRFYDYYNNSPINVNSTPLRVYGGFSGLITPRLSALLKVGYGNGFYESDASFNSVLATVEAGYQLGPLSKMRLGYTRDFVDSPYTNFVAFHQVYADYNHVIMNRLILQLGIDYAYREHDGFRRLNSAMGTTFTALDVNRVTGSVSLDYQIQDWVYVGAGYDISLQDIPTEQQREDAINVVSFTRHQVFAKLGVSY